jgi:hypothetical protein
MLITIPVCEYIKLLRLEFKKGHIREIWFSVYLIF